MLRFRPRFALSLLLALCTAAAHAQSTLNVGPGQPYTTIQSAINAAQNGDTVLVAPGTYNENINFNGKAITVTSSGGPAATMIDGGKQAASVAFVNNETRSSVLSNFTISGGGDGTTGSVIPGAQGGISIRLASPTITGNIITGAGCFGIGSLAGSPLISNNLISHTHVNAATSSCGAGDGSGIWLTGQSDFYGNFPSQPPQPPLVLHNTIELNTEANALGDEDDPGGAGIAVRASINPYIAYNIIRSNAFGPDLVHLGPAFGSGAGILVFAAGATIANNLIYGNTAVNGGGGVAIENFGLLSTSVNLVNNTIADNSTKPGDGVVTGGEQLSFAGFYPVNLQNNVVAGSSARPMMSCFELPSISDPTAPLPVTFDKNDVFNAGGPATGGFNGSSCNYPVDQDGNQSVDPLFNSQATADYHLTLSSPAIDAGSNAALAGLTLTTDLDGNPRIQDATGHGCTVDIGAYEYPGSKSVCGTNIALSSSLNPSNLGQSVTFTAQLSATSGIPTGAVQFSDGATVLGTQTVSAAGAATFTTGQLAIGSHTITAAFQPTSSFPSVQTSLTQVVNGTATSTQLTSSLNPATFGGSVTFTAAVTSSSGTPGGSITFADGSTTLAVVPISSGTAVYTTSALAVGSHAITATFASSGSNTSSSAALTEIITGQPTSTSLTVTPNPVTAFGTLTLTSTVSAASGTPSGTVTFNANGTRLGSAPVNATGGASVGIAASLPGTYTVTAVYSGDPSYSTSTSAPVTETVLAAASTTTLTAAPNPAYQSQAVTLSAAVAGVSGQTPTGAVTFFDGTTSLGTGSLSATGTATLAVNTLLPGTHTLTATYNAGGAYTSSQSSPVAEVILAGTFDVALSPSAISLSPGKTGTVQVVLSSVGNFSGPLQLALGAMPAYANATLTPGTVTLTAGGTGSANLLLNAATARLEPAPLFPSGRSGTALAALALLLLPLRARQRKLLRQVLGTVLLAALLTAATGCGTVGFPFHTAAPGTYEIPVTATDHQGNSQSAMLTLTVTP